MSEPIVIRSYCGGDPSRVCYFYYKLYEQQYHFNGSVEKYFIRGMADLWDDPEGNQLWVAERDGQVVGCIAVIRRGAEEAQLRWFGVDMVIQGEGLGHRLMDTAMAFCKAHGYRHLALWTIEILKPARHLYGSYGFRLTDTKPNYEWADEPLLEEKWDYFEEQEGQQA